MIAPRAFKAVAWLGFIFNLGVCLLIVMGGVCGVVLPNALAGISVWSEMVAPYENRQFAIFCGGLVALLGFGFGVPLIQYAREIRLLKLAGWVGAQKVMLWQAGVGSVALFAVLIAIDQTSEQATLVALFGVLILGGIAALFVQPHIVNLEVGGARQAEIAERLARSREDDVEARLGRIEAAIAAIPHLTPPSPPPAEPWWRRFLTRPITRGR